MAPAMKRRAEIGGDRGAEGPSRKRPWPPEGGKKHHRKPHAGKPIKLVGMPRPLPRKLAEGEEGPSRELLDKYSRGPANSMKKVVDRKLRSGLRLAEIKARDAVLRAAEAEVLLPAAAGGIEAEGPLERTYRLPQRELKTYLDLNAARNAFDLSLPKLGPYRIAFSRNGRHLLLGGTLGHLAVLDALRMSVHVEVQLKEPINDVCALHNDTLFAAAQRKYVYIYDQDGAEVHCLRQHIEPRRLQFLPYHFLLASVGRTGYLKYQDLSTGSLVAELRTKLGACDVMRQNPHNAVMHLGHANGVVSLWSPAMGQPLARLLCHRGPVTALAVDGGGRHMVTAGQDGKTKVWDLRKFKELHAYSTPHAPTVMDISQRGMLALGYGCHVQQVWRDALSVKAKSPYLEHALPGGSLLHGAAFRPYEDLLGLGHGDGYATMVVPGAGEPNFDTFEANPFETTTQRREAEARGGCRVVVQSLLDKLQPETIALDPTFIGRVDADPAALLQEQRELRKKREKNKMRGRNKTGAKLARKQKNVVDAATAKLRASIDAEKARRKEEKEREQRLEEAAGAPRALARFFDK
ncbi:unnamed protein product [Phaeothamnion confervicola]